MDRRSFLKSIGILLAAAAATAIPGAVHTALAANDSTTAWRTFELTTRVEILDPEGGAKGDMQFTSPRSAGYSQTV